MEIFSSTPEENRSPNMKSLSCLLPTVTNGSDCNTQPTTLTPHQTGVHMRFVLAALLALAGLPAFAGTVTIYTTAATHTVTGTSYVNTTENAGDFTVIGATVTSSGPPSTALKVKGYTGFLGGVTTSTASVTFQGCVLLNFQGSESGLLHYEIFCYQQTGAF